MINFSRCYITVGNLAKAIEFYSKVFGEPTYLEIGQWAWFNGQFVINQSSNQNICFCNIIPGFGVSTEKELENLYQSLLDSGKKVTAPKIVSNTPGYYYKYIRLTDDWGNSIEIAYSRKEITRVVHCKRDAYDIYIGRPSKWGNPFSHKSGTLAKFKVDTLEDAIAAYRKYITEGEGKHLLNDLHELKGKVLGYWCSPWPCHGDILAELCNNA